MKGSLFGLSVFNLIFSAQAIPWYPREGRALLKERQVEQPAPDVSPYSSGIDTSNHWYPNNLTLFTRDYIPNTFQTTPYVANGYFGQRFSVSGTGFHRQINESDPDGPYQYINGWPLDDPRVTFGTISGFWDSQPNTTRTNFADIQNGESVISGLPTWAVLNLLTSDGQVYGPDVANSSISNFYQSMSLQYGVVSTVVDWKPQGSDITYHLNYTWFANRFRPNVASGQLDITASADTSITVIDILDGQGALRTTPVGTGMEMGLDNTIFSGVHPDGLTNVTAYVYSTVDFSDSMGVSGRASAANLPSVSNNVSTVSQQFQVNLTAGQIFTVYKHVGAASSDAFGQDTQVVARTASLAARNAGIDQLYLEHMHSWDQIWDDGIITAEDDTELHIAIQASVFHLLSSLRSGNEQVGLQDNSIAVGGLTSDSYAGFIFWDADLWMFPGISTMWPEFSLPIINYRSRLLPQSTLNAVGAGYSNNTAAYSWTSGRFGKCTGTGPCFNYQYHLNADIVLSVTEYYAQTGDTQFLIETGWPLIEHIANFFSEYVKFVNGSYHTFNLTDPDEYANHVDDGAYTNYAIKTVMERAIMLAPVVNYDVPENWTKIRDQMFLPFDAQAQIIPEYTGMNGSIDIKQVDVGLIYYPLGFSWNTSQATNDLFYYAKAQSPDGPAMTWSIYSIVAAALTDTGCESWTHAVQGSQSYLRAPWYQFSEQVDDNFFTNGGTNPAFPFLTGHGGYLQVWTHGYTGYRAKNNTFYLDPSLPPQMDGGIRYHGFQWQGASFDIYIGQDETNITRIPSFNSYLEYQGNVPIQIGPKNENAGNYTLGMFQTLIVKTRLPHKAPPYIPGNVAQCTPVTSNVTWAPANFPIAAVDGSNATTWRPSTTGASSITVDLTATFPPPPDMAGDMQSGNHRIHSTIITWGEIPARTWTLEIANSTNGPWEHVWTQQLVKISVPYNATKYIVPVLENGNSTTQAFDREYEGRYVRFTIEGSLDNPNRFGYGATVAELALIGY